MKILFNPFTKLSGYLAIILGIVTIVAIALLSVQANLNIESLFLTSFESNTFNDAIIKNFILAIVLAVFILIAAIISGIKNNNLFKLIGLTFISRFPITLIPLIALILPVEEIKFRSGLADSLFTASEWLIVLFFGFILLVVWVWFVILLYNAFQLVIKEKVRNTMLWFALALILAEISSNYIVSIL